MDWTQKLSGDAYRRYWADRMAKGPEQAGCGDYSRAQTDEQGDRIWEFVKRALAETSKPELVLELGSGHGRMLRRLRALWPKSPLMGIDIAAKALRASWRDENTQLLEELPDCCRPDVALTCTVLQHITDRETFEASVGWLRRNLRRRGRLVLFENVSKPGAFHVLDFSAEDYMECFPKVDWQEPKVLELRGQEHALMVGVKR